MHIIILILLAAMVLAYDLQCPDLSQRQLRSRGLCVGNSSYTCLEDVNIHTFNESCSEVEAPVRAGRKYVYKGQTTDIECSKHRYQPIKFYKTSAAVCLFLKSLCAEVGQIVARKGSSIIDTTCICDYGEGYAYVTRPADVCSCVPSREDCTCYEKKCPKDHILSADSKCIYRNTPNVTVCATDNKSGKSATTTVRTDFTALNNAPVRKQIQTKELSIICSIVITVLGVSFWLIIIICRCKGYCVKAKSDEPDTSSFHKESNEEHEQQKQISSNVVALGNQMNAEVLAWIQETTAERRKCSCYDSHAQDIKDWEQQDELFVKTSVVDVILKKLETNHCITVTGTPGMGKSAIIQHIALLLHRKQGYAIFPCTQPEEIKHHYKKDHLQLFVFDDVCGKYTAIQNDVEKWIKEEKNINICLTERKTKILSSCRLQVFKEKQLKKITLFNRCSIDLTSDEHPLTRKEKNEIALKYLDSDTVNRLQDIFEKSEFLPLTYFLYKKISPSTGNVQDFLSDPFHVYTGELNKMKDESNNTKWCALFLCILHGGKIEESYFGHEHDNKRPELKIILDHCCQIKATLLHVKEQLESLVGTYIKKSKSNEKVFYTIIHDKMFDFLCHYFGQNQQTIFIKHTKASVLRERTQLKSLNKVYDKFMVIIEKENEDEFFQRCSEVWKDRNYATVLNFDQMKFEQFREKLINKIKLLDPLHLSLPANDMESALDIVCKSGYHDMFCFLKQKSDPSINTNELLQSACYGGNVDIVKDLINMDANVNYIAHHTSPLIVACKFGHLPVVTLLIDERADVNGTIYWYSPLISACEGGHLPIVTLLIDKGADVNFTKVWNSPLILACRCGHLPIVNLLIDEGADVNHTTFMYSPLISACEVGHLPIVILLIDKGADVNVTANCYSPLISACRGGHLPIVTLLIDKGADVNVTTHGYSPLISACEVGHLPIVTLLIDKGAILNFKNSNGQTPLYCAKNSYRQNSNVVNLLVQKGGEL